MMRTSIVKILALWTALAGTVACESDDDSGSPGDNFDRRTLLVNWADNIIIPAYTDYRSALTALEASSQTFANQPTAANLAAVRADFRQAYIKWQGVGIFNIGKAEALTLTNFTNIYPTDTVQIENHVANGGYNLTLPSTFDEQGLPAIDYLLYGTASTEVEIVNQYSQNPAYGNYLTELTGRLLDLTEEVVRDWNNGYREQFVNNDGSSASASTDKMANDFIYYLEKSLRAGKIGIPAGVFSGGQIPTSVEAYYADTLSKTLYMHSLQATLSFFEGRHYQSDSNGTGLDDYLNSLDIQHNGERLSEVITGNFQEARQEGAMLNADLSESVKNNNAQMLATYDELQENVILLKVDMLQALNIRVDYIDADGD